MRPGSTSPHRRHLVNGGSWFRTTGLASIRDTRRRFLVCSSDLIMTTIAAAPGLGWRFANEWLSNMEDGSGSNLKREKDQPSSSQFRAERPDRRLTLLLVEDNLPDALM